MNMQSPADLLQTLRLAGAYPIPHADTLVRGQEGFYGQLVEDIVIAAPVEQVHRLLTGVTAWTLLPYVHDARMTYDDGLYQELLIDLGSFGQIRSARRCEPGQITFFEPKTLDFLRHRCGDWIMRALGPDATHLTAVQRWTLSSMEGRHQPVASLLGQQTRIALATWKQDLERGIGP